MRIILSIIALFSAGGLLAQEYVPTCGRELPREPLLVAECKAPGIPVGRQTLAQAVRYNSVLKARYVVLTNGLKHYCCELRDGEYVQLGAFPRFGAR